MPTNNTMADVREWYFRKIMANIPFLLENFDEQRGSFCCGEAKDQHCLRPLAWFYKNRVAGNPYFGDASILNKILRAGDSMCANATVSRHSGTLGGEWTPYNLAECLDWLGGEVGKERAARWRAKLAEHLELLKQTSNYIATAPNHFIWRAALFYRAGALFDHDAWRRTGAMLARQICKAQTPDGYWEEAHRGQGPSPSYHRVHLHGFDLYYRVSNDPDVKPALDKAVEFAVRAAYPDGVAIETFDGRQPYAGVFAAGMAANALSRTPAGRRLLRNQMAASDKLGGLDARNPVGYAMRWYSLAGTDFMLDGYIHLDDGPSESEMEPLPQERESHSDTFMLSGQNGIGGGAVFRKGPWFAAVSAAESDVARFIPNVYITERQSGFSVFHQDAGLLVGGGNRMRSHIPLANAIVLTGYQDVDCTAGVFSAPYLNAAPQDFTPNEQTPYVTASQPRHGHEGIDPVKCCYHPIQRRVELRKSGAGEVTGAELFLEFMHGTIRFKLRAIDARRFEIAYAFDTLNVKKILLQVPVPVFHPGEFEIDGKQHKVEDLEKLESLPIKERLTLKARDRGVRYKLAEPEAAAFTFPLEPVKNAKAKGINYEPDAVFKPLYTIGLISREFRAERKDGVLLTIEIG